MARPAKQGIDYFPMDVDLDQDDKLLMVIGEFGIKGEIIYTKLLGWIYKHNGYFAPWSEVEQLKFAKRVSYIGGAPVNLINEIVARCIKWGLFDQSVFMSLQVLTSVRIQKTWLDATRKRKDREIDSKYWLIGVNDGIKAEETELTAEVTNKVKESKVKEIKEEKDSVAESETDSPSSTNSLEEKQQKMLKRQKEFYDSIAAYVSQYPKEMLRAFYTHFSEPNKSRTKMKWELEQTWDISLRLIKWEKREQTFNKGKTTQNVSGKSTEELQKERQAIEERTRNIANS